MGYLCYLIPGLPGSRIDAVRETGTEMRYAIPSGTWYDLDRLLWIAVAERNTFDRNEERFSDRFSTSSVDMVIIPATTGQMGVLPGHVATIAELKPGVMSVHEGNDVTKYFVSSGFAFIHANSYADVIAVEAVPIDQIDPSQVQKGLADFTQKLSSASTDLEKAEAQIGVDVHSALNSALTG
ncbi:ATPase, F1 complex, delta/epsilon subunit [Actinidia rufa]|uniref:ATPase, F1 complex, delta/epsilon subunit n=1 Tax=Actinidia rufa TaxID=165716 RepID=A0A7J0EVV1_9ERIC|nr:ATPase, F1 complex, delta/epsilon subunit [Actinidia rufa]